MLLSGFVWILLMANIGIVFPQSLLRTQRCDERKLLLIESECMPCAIALKYSCTGSLKKTTGVGNIGCRYTVNTGGVVLSLQGCSHMCQTTTIQPKCCKGYWGSICAECPGGPARPCSNHGTCMEGLQGNGTCICNEGFTGFACNECSDPTLYGVNCDSACNCIHGVCKRGRNGDGRCICEAGYKGLTCEEESVPCSKKNCGPNASCVELRGVAICDCMPGYYRKGSACEAKDPCSPSQCSPYAICKSSGPQQYTCTCRTDYYGDGKTCLPFNPCSVNNGGCIENSTKCVYKSPGKSFCSCLPGMITRNISMGCYSPQVCTISCGKSAQCITVSPGVHRCACHDGELSDGRNCYGSLLYEIQKLNIEDLKMRRQPGAIRQFEEGCGLSLRKYGPFTVLMPLMKPRSVNETEAKQFCKDHIIAGQYLLSDLKKIGKLWTISGESLEFSNQQFIKETEPDQTYKIIKIDFPAVNGIFHVIDNPIRSNNLEAIGNRQMTIGDIIATNGMFSSFHTMLENCGLPSILNGHGTFTVLVPTNKAVDSIRDGRLIHLFIEAKHKLLELVSYHISSVAAITIDRLITMPHILTSLNEFLKINVTGNGRILFGDEGVPLVHSDIVASNGIIHVLDGILIPSTILPILPATCNETKKEVVQGTCSKCDSPLPCPDGSTDMGTIDRGCHYEDGGKSALGCARNCSLPVTVNGCCKGFYGPDCKPCPGGFSNPCYGRGTCNDGMNGNGKCECYHRYKGIACHICTEPNKHGDECEEECRCLHGICDNRPGSRGICQGGRCNVGYIGEYCDRLSEPCTAVNMTQYCHVNAVCVSTDNITSCLCKNGYQGDGSFCQPLDQCKMPDRGGCSENAICTIAPTGGVICQCIPGWTGDGIECIPIDNCALENRSGCDINADCKFVRPGKIDCICKKGYTGDGYFCDPVNICLEDNGGCHLMELLGIPDARLFREWIKKSEISISLSSNVTALIPSNAALGTLSESTRKFWEDKLSYLVRVHFLRGAFTSEDLKQHIGQELDTMDPKTKWEIGTIKGNITVSNASIMVQNIPATNGYIFIINQLLIPPPGAIPPARPGLYQMLDQVPAFTQFKQAIQKIGLIQEIESSGQKYTIFVPNNSSVSGFYNQSGFTDLNNITIQYHIILGEKLAPSDISNGMHRSSMLGVSYWLMFYKRYNQTFVHDVPLDGSFYETNNGILMGISQVIKVLKNRCDISKTIVTKTECLHCSRTIECPEGSFQEYYPRRAFGICRYTHHYYYYSCEFNCITTKTDPQCCEGYYGHQCLVCPGGLNNICSNNGKCQDRINGTGECICKEGFHGTACETCEAGRFGKDCKAGCKCVHGKCNDGINGDGFCHCEKGWTGHTCEIDLKTDLCNGSCSIYANCISNSTKPPVRCSCIAGYAGNGTHCTEIDPCTVNNGGCSKYANCTKEVFGQAHCTCIDGYSGDGIICLEIDACLKNNGGCHRYAECTKTGPNRVACNCLSGYKGDGIQFCTEIDVCEENNGGCSKFAMCLFYGSGTRICRCSFSFRGDGFTCTGNIAQMLRYAEETQDFYFRLLRFDNSLSGDGPFTVFVPQNAVMSNSTEVVEWRTNGIFKHLLQYHIVGCQKILTDDLQKMSSLTTISGGTLRVSTKNGEVYLNDFARITKSDMEGTDGVIHIIDQVLIPEVPVSNSSNPMNISEVAELYGFSKFIQLLRDSKLISVVQDKIHQPITVLLPTNEAFASLPDQQKLWLYHEDHRDKLKAYLKAHIIRSTKVMAVALPAAKSLRTLHGSTISFQCSSTNIGEILVDNNNAKIVKRDMEFIGGIAHGIDHLLEPPNLGARCDEFTETKVDQHHCSICGFERGCSFDTIDRGETEACIESYSRDYLFSSVYRQQYRPYSPYRRPRTLCARKCYTVTWVPQCCKNHYGGDCHVCPGGLEAPCNNHGTCTDGLEGNGQCSCSLGFTGTACEICAPKRYGPDCEECTCSRNGQCNEGISGDGSCFCAEGWFGEKCETKQPSAPVCSPKCDSNAMCRANNECECNPVYEGDGRTCSVIDLCSTYNGGCSLHAKCSQTETRLSCECLPEYEGDGRICIPINLCIKDENGGCSEHATCFYTGPKTRRCECHEGYVGNGVQCLEKVIPPVDRCLEENGGCADQASCEDWHYQEKTGGVFHLQSPKGNYQYTYEDAEKACASEGARIATFQQLSAAQQLGYHRCLIGWLYNRTAGYPTVYPNARCGNNHVGIVEHKLETNTRETLDVYCYRLQDTDCQCPDGYVGDGSFCNGNLLQVLEANPRLSKFYSMVLDNGMINSQGSEFIDVLSNRTSYRTLFVPDDASLDDNATLTLRDLEHHISKLDILVPYSNLTHGSTMLSKLGYNLLISHTTNCSTAPCPKVVNDNVILYWDIPAFNGIIHIIKGPLVAPPVQVAKDSQISHPVTTALVIAIILLTVAGVAAGHFYYKKKTKGFYFRRLKEENGDIDLQNPPLVSIPNPVYAVSTPFLDEIEDNESSETDHILH
ncbi:stabilin-1 isoform X2 [Eleutherodactylus coqui]|uniref:stabilin-1 isoform X2 n=1 Tax=Eleutherodactylus coqui TaxID=57060 RepID=UPI003462296C